MTDPTRMCYHEFMISIHYVTVVVDGHNVKAFALRAVLTVVLGNNLLLSILFISVCEQFTISGRWIKVIALLCCVTLADCLIKISGCGTDFSSVSRGGRRWAGRRSSGFISALREPSSGKH